jgi:hypothetical protein
LTKRMENLSLTDQSILPKIACIGSVFTYRKFHVVVEDTLQKGLDEKGVEMASSMIDLGNNGSNPKAILDNLEFEGMLIVNTKNGLIKWAHDKVREAALNLIGEDEGAIAKVKFAVGRLLLSQRNPNEIDTSRELFVITNLLNSGVDEVTSGLFRNEIIHLNILSGESALQSASYGSAAWYFTKGLQLLPVDDQKWEEDCYQMTLGVYSGSAVAHSCIGQHDIVQELKNQVIHGSQPETPIVELRRVYDAYMDSLSAQGRTAEALTEVVQILKVLGCRFPKYGRTVRCIGSLIHMTTSIDKRTKKISELQPCKETNVDWIMSLLNRMSAYCYLIDPGMLPLVCIKGLNYTLSHGIVEYSTANLASIGVVLAAILGNFAGGQKYANLACKCTSQNTEARTVLISNSLVYHLLIPYESCKKPLLKAYEAGLRSGDLGSGLWAINQFLQLQVFTSAHLPELLGDLYRYCWQMKVHQQDKVLRNTLFAFQLVSNLAKRGSQRHVLTGEIMDERKFEALGKGNRGLIHDWVHYNRHKVYAAFWFGEHQLVTELIERENYDKFSIEKVSPGLPGVFTMYAHCALSSISMYRKSGTKKHKNWANVFFKRIRDLVRKGNKNVRHFEALIKAELATLGKKWMRRGHRDPTSLYEVAILLAGRWGLTSDHALAHERVADYAMSIGEMDDAKYHYSKALELYADWGAYGKVQHLQDSLVPNPNLAPLTSMVFEGSYNRTDSLDYSFLSGAMNLSSLEEEGHES